MRWWVAAAWLIAVRGGALEFPGPDPGPVSVTQDARRVAIGNRAIEIEFPSDDVWSAGLTWRNKLTGQCVQLPPFAPHEDRLEPDLLGRPLTTTTTSARLPASPHAARLAERTPGYAVETAADCADRVIVRRVEAHDGDNTIRTTLAERHRQAGNTAAIVRIGPGMPWLKQPPVVRWLSGRIAGSRSLGQVTGSPLAVGDLFFGVEDPHGHNDTLAQATSLGRWQPEQLSLRHSVRLHWPVPRNALAAGTNQARFAYAHGVCRLDVWEAKLLCNGRVVAVDRHHGWAGTPNSGESYRFEVPTVDPHANYTLEAEVGTDFSWPGLAGLTQLDSAGEVLWQAPNDQARCYTTSTGPWPPGEVRSSFVVGAVPPGQMRRGFLYYLERYRAHPYRPFLHYNSWYDRAWEPFALNEANCLEAMREFAEPLRARGVTIDSFVFDDGWDDPHTLWDFHSGFPHGFTPHAALARQYGSHVGTWLSPFGGYGSPKEQRLAFGREQHYGTNATGFALSDSRYYERFRQVCTAMVTAYGVNSFKFDGIAGGSYVSGPADHEPDTLALQRLMAELHQLAPDVFINFTTGSWPSPFWLMSADSLWRQGEDTSFAGVGPPQQQWLTYRDREVYRNIVRRAPLFPLNSLTSHGVAWSRHGNPGNPSYTSAGFADDVHALFGSGTALQELCIQPNKLSATDWDVLAEAAKWSRANADVLVDTHWVGGDPGELQAYGWASWSPRRAILTLRNPSNRPQTFTLEPAAALELPAGAPRRYRFCSAWGPTTDDAPSFVATAGQRVMLALRPFEVRTLEGEPVGGARFDTAAATR